MLEGSLFTRDYLTLGITETPSWAALAATDVERFIAAASEALRGFTPASAENEDVTKTELIEPVLDALGWISRLGEQQADARGRTEVPDLILFGSEADKAQARRERQPGERWRHGLSFLEAKRWQRPLDRGRDEVPSAKMLGYLTRVEVISDRRIQWGILTNGRHWRLYYQGARSRAEEMLEIDLPACLGLPGFEPDLVARAAVEPRHALRLFCLLFRPEAFQPLPGDGRTLHQLARDEGRHWEARVAQDLSGEVFDTVFPELLDALADADPGRPASLGEAYLTELRDAALTLLYRLLFLLYAEDRGLLPLADRRYADYSLRRLRDEAASRLGEGQGFSARRHQFYNEVRELFATIDQGDSALGLPTYNGELFDPGRVPLLDRSQLADARFVPLLDRLSRRAEAGVQRRINYRDLSVRQLGSIYERLLEYQPYVKADGRLGARL